MVVKNAAKEGVGTVPGVTGTALIWGVPECFPED